MLTPWAWTMKGRYGNAEAWRKNPRASTQMAPVAGQGTRSGRRLQPASLPTLGAAAIVAEDPEPARVLIIPVAEEQIG